MEMTADRGSRRPIDLALAFGSGGLLTLMILCNGTVAGVTSGHFASLAAHATGSVAALLLLAVVPGRRALRVGSVPWWAYLGGVAGALTVTIGSIAMNSPLALSGMLALGLAGQTVFGLVSDRFAWFGMPRRDPDRRDALTIGLILAGCGLIIFGGTS